MIPYGSDEIQHADADLLKTYGVEPGRFFTLIARPEPENSVLEVVQAFERANSIRIPFNIGPRRAGDIPTSYTDPSLANADLNWRAEKTIEDICRDAWSWQQKNPDGYRGAAR